MATTNEQFTVADLELMPEDGNRYEVIDGELHVTAAPHFDHQLAVDRLTVALGNWDDEHGLGVAASGPGVIFAYHSGVIPDLVWVSNERMDTVFRREGTRDGKLHAAPDLAVEVLSPGAENEQRDREIKLKLYSRHGVREYWIVDRAARTIAVYRRTEAAVLALALTLTERDTLTSPLLHGFALPVERVFLLPPQFRR
jgi:Uma2 family endonuclease